MAVELVVQLPADDLRFALVVLSEGGADAVGQAEVLRRRVVEVAAAAVGHGRAVEVPAEDFGVLVGNPRRGAVGRRAEDHLELVLAAQGNGAVEEVKLIAAFFGLEIAPGAFADADVVKTGRGDATQVIIVAGGIPVLGVVAHAEAETVEVHGCSLFESALPMGWGT